MHWGIIKNMENDTLRLKRQFSEPLKCEIPSSHIQTYAVAYPGIVCRVFNKFRCGQRAERTGIYD
jgi:hypothetical protein